MDDLTVTPELIDEYARRYGLTPAQVTEHFRQRWESRAVQAEDRNPSPFLQALRSALGSDWTWADDLTRRRWVVEHKGGLRFEACPEGGWEEGVASEEGPKMAAVLLDAVEDGVKGLVVVEIRKSLVQVHGQPARAVYTYSVVPALRMSP